LSHKITGLAHQRTATDRDNRVSSSGFLAKDDADNINTAANVSALLRKHDLARRLQCVGEDYRKSSFVYQTGTKPHTCLSAIRSTMAMI
ncbi:MAG: hypothetical protein AAFY53_15185, partial [Pseudomonadota bacterium]